jgi:hypothetical protein
MMISKTFSVALIFAAAISFTADAQRQAPASLPDVTPDCYRSFSTATTLPEKPYSEDPPQLMATILKSLFTGYR